MKINVIPSVIAIALAALLGYAVYSVAGNNPNEEIAFAVSGRFVSSSAFCLDLACRMRTRGKESAFISCL